MKAFGGIVSAARLACVFAWTAGLITLALVFRLVTFSPRASLWLARRAWAPGVLWLCGAKLELEPLPPLDWSRPYVFVMNHQSGLDICCAFVAVPTGLRFVAKHTLAYVPFLGWFMWATGMVFIDRSNRFKAMASLKKAGERIRAGASILMYPEGTRSKDGTVLPFKKGPFLVALEAGVPVVPVAVEGSAQVLAATGLRIRPGTIRVKVGMPVASEGRGRVELLSEVRTAVLALNRELGGPGGGTQHVARERAEERGAD
ncbi:MAG: hypothetical protein RL653_2260 [Pseudomonadota bacterium]|jgi:1-acyl-sn-glycerol-3-phosphate acyltransferase